MNKVLVIDFGSQYCKLIARKIRELGVYSEILPANKPNIIELAKSYDALILSGGPNSVYDPNSLTISKEIFNLNIPILGTCYGMQLIHHLLGGKVEKLEHGEYGKIVLNINKDSPFVSEINKKSIVWMSHFDTVTIPAPGFEVVASTSLCNAITQNLDKKIFTTQFHPEVTHTEFGLKIFENFLNLAKIKRDWKIASILEEKIQQTKTFLGTNKVLLGLSGGVDSSVLVALIAKVNPNNLIPVFIDNGLLRKNEAENVRNVFEKQMGLNLIVVDAKQDFYAALKGISEPERKRQIIGKLFIEKFHHIQEKYKDIKFLAQGTIYPDVIESAGTDKVAHTIKSHHNVGGLPEKINFVIFEPLRDLFKDEVRKLGEELGLPHEMVMRHPFPGPGLGIRIIGEINEEKVKILQQVDEVLIDFLYEKNIYYQVSQAAAILTPIKTVGVQGDERTYENLVALRIVQTTDFMTASFAHIDFNLLDELSSRIINRCSNVNRVVYDITSKPPATIEWE